jgi:hypothetical protein
MAPPPNHPDWLADRVRLHRQVDSRPVVVGEGDADRRIAARVLPEGEVVFFVAGTRDLVLETARRVPDLRLHEIACVVDRDFDDEVGHAEQDGLVVASYDEADLEAMLWWSPALDDVVHELGSEAKLRAFGGIGAVREVAVDVLRPLQRLRRASAVSGWGLNFDGLDLRRRISVEHLTMKEQSLCDALWRDELDVPKSDLYEAARTWPEALCPTSGRPLIRGRDALAAVGVALRRAVGTLSFQEVNPSRLSEILRLRASPDALARTGWITRVRELLELS